MTSIQAGQKKSTDLIETGKSNQFSHKLSMMAHRNDSVSFISSLRLPRKAKKEIDPIKKLKTEEDIENFIKRKLEAISIRLWRTNAEGHCFPDESGLHIYFYED